MRSLGFLTLIFSIVFGPALCCCTAREVPSCCAEKKPVQEEKKTPAVPSCCKKHRDKEATVPVQAPAPAPLEHSECLCHVERTTAIPSPAAVAVDPPSFADWVALADETLTTSPCRNDEAIRINWPGGDAATFLLDFCHILRC